jgi:acetyl-CoA C-acetyltransferase
LNSIDKFNIPEEKVNIKVGPNAIGNPLGSTMIGLTGNLARILKEKKVKYDVSYACMGGVQVVATITENLDI